MAEKQIWTGTGRRKRSSAQVRMTLGKGNITVNGVPVDEYLPYQTLVMDLKQPLVATGNEEKFDIEVTVKGGGFSGQTGAIRLGIARACCSGVCSHHTFGSSTCLPWKRRTGKSDTGYGPSSEKTGKTICDPDHGPEHCFFRNFI